MTHLVGREILQGGLELRQRCNPNFGLSQKPQKNEKENSLSAALQRALPPHAAKVVPPVVHKYEASGVSRVGVGVKRVEPVVAQRSPVRKVVLMLWLVKIRKQLLKEKMLFALECFSLLIMILFHHSPCVASTMTDNSVQ